MGPGCGVYYNNDIVNDNNAIVIVALALLQSNNQKILSPHSETVREELKSYENNKFH